MIDRRRFIRTLAAAAAGAVFDPERLLWVPGRKSFFLPSPPKLAFHPDAFVMVMAEIEFQRALNYRASAIVESVALAPQASWLLSSRP